MKKTKKIVALLLALTLLFGAMVGMLSSCGDTDEDDGDPCTHVDADKNGKCDDCGETVEVAPTEKTTYTVSVKSAGGLPLEDVTVVVYTDNKLDKIESFAVTGADGLATFSLYPSNDYAIEINSGVPDGYEVEPYYTFSGASAAISLTSKVLENTSLAGVSYKLGDIIRDFTATMSDGTKVTLSELLKTKEAVLINFWYTTCSWCVEEFPYMDSAYQNYEEDIAIVALDPYDTDTDTDINLFKAQYGLSFPMGHDVGLAAAFGVDGYPTSVVVDRYGAICLIENGAITGEKYFNKIFDHFIAEPYEQKLIVDYTDLAPVEKPNITQPSSEEINAVISPNAGINYYPETGTADAEYSWPFIIGEKDGVPCIMSSNAMKDSSYSTIHAEVTLGANQALGIEYFSSTELGSDLLYILVDGVSVSNISGVNENGWETCYPYVAREAGTYKVTLIYLKDSSTDTGDDTIYIKKLFVEDDLDAIDVETYIPRWAATVPNTNGLGYQNYVSVVLNPDDGYYHVGSATGPLLLANLMGVTPFSASDSVYSIVYNSMATNGSLAGDYDAIVKYCNYASNAKINGVCTVNEGLKNYLVKVAEAAGYEKNNPDQWLQFCLYYDAYGTDGKELEDPIEGLAPHSAPEAVPNATVGLEEYPNVYVYDRVIMPRGLWYRFTPTVSGAYKIVSNVSKTSTNISESLNGWIFLEDGSLYYQYSISERIINDSNNVYMYVYLEAGEDYYIDIAYYDMYNFDTFGFKIEYLGESVDVFRAVSAGAPFTYEVDADGNVTDTVIPGGTKVVYDAAEDRYYNVLPDGTKGSSKIYADFTMLTSIFGNKNLSEMIDLGAFNFAMTENDYNGLLILAEYPTDDDLREYWGDDFDANYELYNIADLRNNIFHGKGEDLTAKAREYYAKIITDTTNPMDPDSGVAEYPLEMRGCVEVNKELAGVLQTLMDKYTFSGVENSWVKLCYYYETVGEGWEYISELS